MAGPDVASEAKRRGRVNSRFVIIPEDEKGIGGNLMTFVEQVERR